MIPYDEKGFEQSVDTVLKPWVAEHVTGGTFSSYDGTAIQYYSAVQPQAKAVIVMLHGFCEFFGKFHETAYDFWENGYTVFFIEQRGHGGSGRSVDEPDLVDVQDFSEYVQDLKCFLDQVVIPETPLIRTRAGLGSDTDPEKEGQNLLLYAHSMGGCVGTLFLEQYPEYFCAGVLSSPMLKMNFGAMPAWQVKVMQVAARLPAQRKQSMPGMNRFDPDRPNFEGSGSSCLARFMYQFALRTDPASGGIYTMNRGTLGWGVAAMAAVKEAERHEEKIKIPLLVCQAGKDVYVDNEGQNEIARRAKHVKLVHFPDAEHEIYAGDPASLEKYYRELLAFYRKAANIGKPDLKERIEL